MTDLRRSLLDRAKGYEQEAAKTQGTLSAYWRGIAHGLSMAADMVRSDEYRRSVETFAARVTQIDPLSGLETHVDNGARGIVDALGKTIERIQGDEGDDK